MKLKITNRKIAAIVTVVGIVLIGIGGGSNTSAPTDKTPDQIQVITPAKEKIWTTIGSWEGNGLKTTEVFTISGDSRLSWETKNNADISGNFAIMVYNEAGGLETVTANVQGPAKDMSYLHLKKGKYYFEVNSCFENWKMVLEEQQ